MNNCVFGVRTKLKDKGSSVLLIWSFEKKIKKYYVSLVGIVPIVSGSI